MLVYGEVTEWFKVTVVKTVVGQLTASSNLALSAKKCGPKKNEGSFFLSKISAYRPTYLGIVEVWH